MGYYDCDETARAIDVYYRWCDRNDYIASVPNRNLSAKEGDIVTLRNARGVLARYRFKPGGKLQRLNDED